MLYNHNNSRFAAAMKKSYSLFLFLVGLANCSWAQSFEEKVTNASDVRLNVTNVGTFGNAFRGYRDGSGTPSCEYPAGSGVEHLFESGIWFGGVVNGQRLVSTSAYDAPQGYSTGKAGFEFTGEVGAKLNERSTLFDSPNYSPKAVSHQDFTAVFSDKNIQVPGTSININGHINPMNVEVTMETYNWNYSFSNFFVILNFTIENKSTEVIDDAYFGLWANTVVRNINITPAGSGGAGFYNKGGNGFDDSLHVAYCYDKGGDVNFTKSYIGHKFLGAEDKNGFHHPKINQNFKVNYNAWAFNNTTDPIFFLPGSDNARYLKLKEGLNQHVCWDQNSSTNSSCPSKSFSEQLNDQGNRSDLVSVGPFKDFKPGDKINVNYAFILGKSKDDGNSPSNNTVAQRAIFKSNASWAQTAYNGEDVNFNGKLDAGEDKDGNNTITRYILPAPPNIPKTRVEAGDNKIDIYWSNNAESSIDPITQKKDFEGYRVYVSKLGFDVLQTPPTLKFIRLAQYDLAGNNKFNETGFGDIKMKEPLKFDGDTTTYHYKYTINNVQNGWQVAAAVTAFDEGDPESSLESLESSTNANDYRIFGGKRANKDPEANEPYVYPNPYYAGAAWEGRSNFQEESRKIMFSNLPENCVIRIYTVAGDLIDEINHDANYNGSDIRWFKTFADENPENNKFSGGEHAWDLLSSDNQIIGRGLYMFTVEDKATNKLYKGKFLIIK